MAKEHIEFLAIPSLQKYMENINKVYNNKTIYLSTDSEILIDDIKKQLRNNVVITSNDYKIGHSGINRFSNGSHIIGVKRAIVDAIVASQCNPLYVTLNSTFGKMISFLSNNSSTTYMSN